MVAEGHQTRAQTLSQPIHGVQKQRESGDWTSRNWEEYCTLKLNRNPPHAYCVLCHSAVPWCGMSTQCPDTWTERRSQLQVSLKGNQTLLVGTGSQAKTAKKWQKKQSWQVERQHDRSCNSAHFSPLHTRPIWWYKRVLSVHASGIQGTPSHLSSLLKGLYHKSARTHPFKFQWGLSCVPKFSLSVFILSLLASLDVESKTRFTDENHRILTVHRPLRVVMFTWRQCGSCAAQWGHPSCSLEVYCNTADFHLAS